MRVSATTPNPITPLKDAGLPGILEALARSSSFIVGCGKFRTIFLAGVSWAVAFCYTLTQTSKVDGNWDLVQLGPLRSYPERKRSRLLHSRSWVRTVKTLAANPASFLSPFPPSSSPVPPFPPSFLSSSTPATPPHRVFLNIICFHKNSKSNT